jgi:hypothetical protein
LQVCRSGFIAILTKFDFHRPNPGRNRLSERAPGAKTNR